MNRLLLNIQSGQREEDFPTVTLPNLSALAFIPITRNFYWVPCVVTFTEPINTEELDSMLNVSKRCWVYQKKG